MSHTWVVVAESSRAKVYAVDGLRAPLRELEDLTHPEGRLLEQELKSDGYGRTYDTVGAGRHGVETGVSPKQQEAIAFARDIATRLEAARVRGQFDKLILVAAPKFLGHLRDSLSASARQMVVKEVDKNLVRHDAEDLRKHLPHAL